MASISRMFAHTAGFFMPQEKERKKLAGNIHKRLTILNHHGVDIDYSERFETLPEALKLYSYDELVYIDTILRLVEKYRMPRENIGILRDIVHRDSKEVAMPLIRFLYEHRDHIESLRNILSVYYIAVAYSKNPVPHLVAAEQFHKRGIDLYHRLPRELHFLIDEYGEKVDIILDLHSKGRDLRAIESILQSPVGNSPMRDGAL